MSEPEKLKRRHWPWILAVSLVLYPLSIGPFGAINHALGPSPMNDIGKLVYAPLIWIAKSTGTQAWLEKYVQIFDLYSELAGMRGDAFSLGE